MKKNAPRNSGVLFSVLMASLLTSWPGLGGHGDLAVAGGSVTRRVAAGNAATGSYRRVSSLSSVAGLSGLSAQAKAILFSSYGVAANLGLPTTGGLPTAASGGSPGSTAVCGLGQSPTVSTIDTAANGSSGVAMAAFAATLATFAPPGPAAIRPGAAENLACVYVTAQDSAAGMLTARAEAAALALRMAELTPSSPSSLQLAASAAAQAQLGVAAENSLLGVQNLGLGSGALADPVTVTTDVEVATTVAQPTSAVDPATQLVTLSSATQGAAIYYTTDGSTPSAANGTLYTGPFAIPSSHNLETFGTDPAWTDSAPALVSNFDSIQPAVTISSPLASSTFSGMVSVTGTCNDSSPGAMVAISVSSSTSPGVSSSTVPCSGTNFMALSLDISGLADGPVTVSAVFTTANGSSSAAPVTFTKALVPVLLLDAATAQASGSPLSDTLACTGVTWADSSSSLLGPATLIDFDAGCSQGGFLGNGTPVDPYRVNFNNPANGYGQATTGSAGPAADTTLAHVLTPSVLTPGDFSVEIFARATPGQNVYSILSQYVFLPGPFTLSSGSTISATYGVPYFDGGVPVNTNAADSIEFFNSGNNPLLASAVGGVSSNGAFNQDATTTFEDGAWHQLVFVSGHNGVQVGKLYMDGVLTADTTLSRTGAVLAQMSIGADQANDEMGMVGDISRMAAYDQALGTDRIYQDCLQQSLRLAGLSCAGPGGGWPIVSTPSNLYLETNLAATVFGGSCDTAGSPVTVVYGPAATQTSTTAACLGGSFQTGNMDLSSLPTGPLPVIAFQTDANGVWEGNRYAYTILGRLAAPTNLAASVDPVSFDTIWSWQGSVGGDGIYRYSTFADPGPSPNPFWPTPTDSTDSYTTAAPLADGRYTIWVQEQDLAGSWGDTATSVDIITVLPPTLVGISTDPITNETTWTWMSGGSGDGVYEFSVGYDPVYYETSGVITTASTNSFTTSSPLSVGIHHFFVREQNAGGSWSQTSQFDVTIAAVGQPILVSSITDPSTSLTTWTWSSGGNGSGVYEFSVGYDPAYYETSGAITTASTNTFTTLSPLHSGPHIFFVRERNAAGDWSPTSQFDVTIAPVGQPVLAQAVPPLTNPFTDPATNLTTWSWLSGGNGSGVYEFSVEYDPAYYETSGVITTASTNSFTTPLPLSSGVHHFYVRERNAAGDWSPTSEFDVTVTPMPVLVATATIPNTDKISLQWASGSSSNGTGTFRYSLTENPSNGPSDIVTVPGSYGIPYPRALAVLGSDLYIATGNKNQVFKMSGGTMSLLAGAGPGGFSGDGGPAAAALLNYPSGVAVDAAGNVYIADLFNYRIRMVAETSGTYFGQPMSAGNIYTIAGSGAYGDLGDGDLAINASMSTPQGVVVDSQGNVYFVDQNANRVRVVYAATGKVAAFAGSGFTGNTGDAGPAIYATMNEPQGLGIDSLGNIYVSDSGNTSVRKINWENGIISTVPGLTTHGSYQIAVDGPGNIFVTDLNNNQVLVVAAATGFFFGEYMTAGTSYVLAGNSSTSETGDGLIAALAGVYGPVGVAVDSAENVYVADGQGNHIRIVTPADGLISSLTGNNPANFGGSGSLPPSYIYTSPLMPAGPQTITVYVQEADGNGGWGQTAILNAYTNFTGPPAPVLVSPSSLDVNTVSVTITWGSGGGSGAGIYQYSTEGDPASGSFAYSTVASNTPGGYNYTTTNIYQGTQTITLYVRERDALGEWGNTATLTTTVTYTPDGYHGLQ